MSLYLISIISNISLISFIALSAYLVLIVGEVSFGQQAFFGIGAYISAIATSLFNVHLIFAIVISIIVGAAVAALLASLTLKLSGVFFSIATLAFAELFRLSMLQVRYTTEVNGRSSGPDGPEGFQNIRWIFENNISPLTFMIILLIILFCVLILFIIAERSRFFKAARLVGEDPILAQSQGLNPEAYRAKMISLSGALAALGGALFAHHSSYIEPSMFGVMLGVHSLAYTIIGGLGTPIGPILGVIFDIGLLESVRSIASYRMIVFGGIVVLLLIILPQGFLNPRFVTKLKIKLGIYRV